MLRSASIFAAAFCAALAPATVGAADTPQESPARVTILYDAFGTSPGLKIGWGYAALVEYGGEANTL